MNSKAQQIYNELSQHIARQNVPLYSTDGVPPDEKRIILKMHDSRTGWRWTVYEGQINRYFDGMTTTTLFGRVQGFEDEIGYFDLQEIIEGSMAGSFSHLHWHKTAGA